MIISTTRVLRGKWQRLRRAMFLSCIAATDTSMYSKACGVFADAIAYHNLSAQYDDFGYCDVWPTGDTVDYLGCIQCLQVNDNYLANCMMPPLNPKPDDDGDLC
jgi:hypothetical protein